MNGGYDCTADSVLNYAGSEWILGGLRMVKSPCNLSAFESKAARVKINTNSLQTTANTAIREITELQITS